MRDIVEDNCKIAVKSDKAASTGEVSGRTRADLDDRWVLPIDHLECLVRYMESCEESGGANVQVPGWSSVDGVVVQAGRIQGSGWILAGALQLYVLFQRKRTGEGEWDDEKSGAVEGRTNEDSTGGGYFYLHASLNPIERTLSLRDALEEKNKPFRKRKLVLGGVCAVSFNGRGS